MSTMHVPGGTSPILYRSRSTSLPPEPRLCIEEQRHDQYFTSPRLLQARGLGFPFALLLAFIHCNLVATTIYRNCISFSLRSVPRHLTADPDENLCDTFGSIPMNERPREEETRKQVNVRGPVGTSLSHEPPQAEEPILRSATASALFKGAHGATASHLPPTQEAAPTMSP